MILKSVPAGSKIGLVAPAGFVEKAKIDTGVRILEQNGFTVAPSPNLYGKNRYFSGTVGERVHDFNTFIEDPEIKMIYAVRGGVGSAQLLPHLNYESLTETGKLIIGFSDVTALQLGVWQISGLPSISGMTLTTHLRDLNPYREFFFEVLNGNKKQISDAELVNDQIRIASHGATTDLLIGGTLSIFVSLLGTSYFPQFDSCILFLEDLNEKLYRIERMLIQLQMAGILEKVSGLILGRFKLEEKFLDPWPVIEYLFPENIPVILNFPYGHFPDMCPLPVGVKATFQTQPFSLSW